MKGYADYIMASAEEMREEFLQDALRQELDDARKHIEEHKQIAKEEETSAHVMFYLLKHSGLQELETFPYAYELDQLATQLGLSLYRTAVFLLIAGLERRCPKGVELSHIAQHVGCSADTVLEHESCFKTLCSLGLIRKVNGNAPTARARYRLFRH